MPNPNLTIDRQRRDGVYELIRNHLGAIGDFWLVFEQNRDYVTAERMGLLPASRSREPHLRIHRRRAG